MPKFSIRDVLLATVIVALALGWFVDRSQRVATPAATPANKYVVITTGSDNRKLMLVDQQTGAVWESLNNGKWSPHTDPLKRPGQ